jgi:phosphohistidine swiveling domain-containing protein
LGETLAKKSQEELSFAKKYCDAIKNNTDILLPMMERLQKKIPTLAEYEEFSSVFDRHLAYHVFIKKTIDFLSIEGLDKLLPMFKDARLYSEKIYSESERFFRNVMKSIAEKESRNADYLTCLTQEEFENYLKSGDLPSEAELTKRYEASVLYFEKDKMFLLFDQDVAKVEKTIAGQAMADKNMVKGITAYPGKISGKARIVLDPFNAPTFNQGDVLVTGMTRPEFMPLIEKSAAIVTDVGGILCHAAITAREMKIPCVVGTAVATKIFKNDDMLEVDAESGIVKKLN